MEKTIDELVREEQDRVEAEKQRQRERFMPKVRSILGDEILDSLYARPSEDDERTLLFTYHGRQFVIVPYSAYSLLVRELKSLNDTSFTTASAFLQFLAQF